MSENKRSHRHHGEHDHNSDLEGRRPYWTRAHRDWKFWVALSLMLAAMVVYVMSDNLTFWPRSQGQQSQSSTIGK
jgi:type II secretory pathway component PulL